MKKDPLSWRKTVYLLRKCLHKKLTMQLLLVFRLITWDRSWIGMTSHLQTICSCSLSALISSGSDLRFYKWILFSSFYLFWVSWVYVVWKVSEYWCFIQIVCCSYKAYLALETISASIQDTFCNVSNFKNETIHLMHGSDQYMAYPRYNDKRLSKF